MSDTPLVMCPPTTGCGKAMEMVRTRNVFPEGWTLPDSCPHCGRQQFPSFVYMVKPAPAESQPILSGTELKTLIGRLMDAWRCRVLEVHAPEHPSAKYGSDADVTAARLALEEYVERLRSVQFSPEGDNHHNAALCPYCNPKQIAKMDALTEQIRALRSSALTPEEAQAILNTWDWYPISSDAKHSAVSKLQGISGRSTYSRESVK